MKKIADLIITVMLLFALAITAWGDLVPVNVKNGQIIVDPDYEQVCPFSVETRSDYTYYVYLEYQSDPTNTTVNRTLKSNADGTQSDISVIVKPDSKVELDVPIGVYKLYYCVGETWYGTKDKFGDNTRYYSSKDLLDFYADSQYYRGHSLELWTQIDGNFEDHPISESGFPDTETNTEGSGTIIYCPECGKQIDASSKFCMYCGYEIKKITAEEQNAKEAQVQQTGIFDPLSEIMDSGYNLTWGTAFSEVPKNEMQVALDGFFITGLILAGEQCTASVYYDETNENIKTITLQGNIDAAVVEKALKNSEFFDYEKDFYGITVNYYMKDGSEWQWLQKNDQGFNIHIYPKK